MEIAKDLLGVLTLLITAGGIVAVVYILLKQYFDNQRQVHEREWKQQKAKDYLPTQMQAYERLILLMERIHPERLVFRVNRSGMSARLLQADMLKVIRDEFDHNLTQQLYISREAWEAVKAAREETVNILKAAAGRVPQEAEGIQLATAVLEISGQLGRLPTDVAIDILKSEFRHKLKG